MKIPLTELEQEKTGKVVEIIGGCGIHQKLDALGIRVGVVIKKISSISTRGPVIIEIGETKIAIGYGMAKRIIVELVHSS